MKVSKFMRDMQDAGAPMEAILIAIEAIETLQKTIDDKKNAARLRKQRSRYSHATVTPIVTDESHDIPLNGSDGFPDPSLTLLKPHKENTPIGVQKKNPKDEVSLPDWLSPEAWQGFREMRVKIKKPMTARAERMAVSKLAGFREKGHDPTEILNQSTFNDYQDLYEPKGNAHAAHIGKYQKPTFKSEGKRLRDKYREDAEREEQGAISGDSGANLRLTESIREDTGRIGDSG